MTTTQVLCEHCALQNRGREQYTSAPTLCFLHLAAFLNRPPPQRTPHTRRLECLRSQIFQPFGHEAPGFRQVGRSYLSHSGKDDWFYPIFWSSPKRNTSWRGHRRKQERMGLKPFRFSGVTFCRAWLFTSMTIG